MQIHEPFSGDSQPRHGATIARVAAGIAGSLIVSASAAAIIVAGHQDAAHATLTAALAAGVVAGAAIVGPAWQARRFGLSAVVIGALFAGEAFNMLATADRIVGEREAAQAANRTALGAHSYATDEQRRAQVAFDAAIRTASETAASGVTKAQTAVDSAERAKIEQAALPGCRAGCVELLKSAEIAARGELDNARRRVEAVEQAPAVVSARADLQVARQRATANPKPEQSASALADRLGWAPWIMDLLTAALLSIAANGLGAALVAFATHSGAHRRPRSTTLVEAPIVDAVVISAPAAASKPALRLVASTDGRTGVADTSRTPKAGHLRTPHVSRVSALSAPSRTPQGGHPRTPRLGGEPDTASAGAVSAWVDRLPLAVPVPVSLRALATDVGSSHQQAGRMLASLAASGAVKVETKRSGTTVTRLA